MSTFGEIKIIERPSLPPIFLGDCSINVPIGSNVNITRNILMNTNPPYQHPLQNPTPNIGSVNIIGFVGNSSNFLSQTNTPTTYGILKNNNDRIYFDGIVNNGYIVNSTMSNNGFKVEGIRIGSGVIRYKATAFDPITNSESDLSTSIGNIQINVYSTTNRPPILTSGGLVLCEYNNYAIFTSSYFLTTYTDPENDAPSMLRINSLPTIGNIIYNGMTLTSSNLPFIIPISDVDDGYLYYHATTSAVVGAVYTFDYNVSDVGSQQFSN